MITKLQNVFIFFLFLLFSSCKDSSEEKIGKPKNTETQILKINNLIGAWGVPVSKDSKDYQEDYRLIFLENSKGIYDRLDGDVFFFDQLQVEGNQIILRKTSNPDPITLQIESLSLDKNQFTILGDEGNPIIWKQIITDTPDYEVEKGRLRSKINAIKRKLLSNSIQGLTNQEIEDQENSIKKLINKINNLNSLFTSDIYARIKDFETQKKLVLQQVIQVKPDPGRSATGTSRLVIEGQNTSEHTPNQVEEATTIVIAKPVKSKAKTSEVVVNSTSKLDNAEDIALEVEKNRLKNLLDQATCESYSQLNTDRNNLSLRIDKLKSIEDISGLEKDIESFNTLLFTYCSEGKSVMNISGQIVPVTDNSKPDNSHQVELEKIPLNEGTKLEKLKVIIDGYCEKLMEVENLIIGNNQKKELSKDLNKPIGDHVIKSNRLYERLVLLSESLQDKSLTELEEIEKDLKNSMKDKFDEIIESGKNCIALLESKP